MAHKTLERVQRDLRLLRHPLYRYPVESESLLDGALFVFVEGTAPDLVLQIEAHRTRDGAEWRNVFAPLYHYRIAVRRNDKDVWASELIPDCVWRSRHATYAQLRFEGD